MILILFLIVFSYFVLIKLWYYILLWRQVNKLPGPKPVPLLGTISYVKTTFKASLLGFHELCEKYDGIYKVWLGPVPYIIIYDADYIKTLLTRTDHVDKSCIPRYFMKQMAGSTLLMNYGRKWRRNRKIIYSSVTQQMVNSFMPMFNKNSSSMVNNLRKELHNSRPFDIGRYVCEAAFDNICETTMGVQLWSVEEKLQFFHAVQSLISARPERFYKLLSGFLLPNTSTKSGETDSDYFNTVFDVVSRILDAKSKQMADENHGMAKKESYLETIIRAKESNEFGPFSDSEFKAEIIAVLVAGYETTSVTLSFVLLYLAAYKDVQDRVYREIDEIFGNSERAVELDDLEKFDYLERTIKEVMRILPTILQLIRQTTKEIQLGEYTIPAGVQVYMSIYHLHHSRKYWNDPEKFDPDRFLPDKMDKQYPYSYLPFGGGTRMCPGLKYGLMFVKIMLIHILRKYEVHTSLKLDLRQLDFTMDISVRLNDGYLISISERK